MIRCPLCKEEIRDDAIKCKHCHSFLKDSEEGVEYLRNGFGKINDECDALEEKVNMLIGIIFVRHKYSVEALLESDHFSKIESFAGKIRTDFETWAATNKLSYRLEILYNHHIEALQARIDRITAKIKQREPTIWEKVCSAFMRLSRILVEKLLPFIPGKLLIGLKRQRFIRG
jgi:hypothetical protein